MNYEDQLADLFLRWKSARSNGDDATPEAICRDHPESIRLQLEGQAEESRAGVATAMGLFLGFAAPDTPIGRHAIECAAGVLPILIQADPQAALPSLETLQRLVGQVMGNEPLELSGRDQFAFRLISADLTMAEGLIFEALQRDPELSRARFQAALEQLHAITDETTTHPQFRRVAGKLCWKSLKPGCPQNRLERVAVQLCCAST